MPHKTVEIILSDPNTSPKKPLVVEAISPKQKISKGPNLPFFSIFPILIDCIFNLCLILTNKI